MQAVKVLFLLGLATLSPAFPADELVIESVDGDTAVVESKIREVRAIANNPSKVKDLLAAGGKGAYIHTFGDGDGDAHGFHRKAEDKGSDGYEHFDSYHKKDSDKYGYEKHTELGKDGKHQDVTDGTSAKYQDEDKENYENDGEHYEEEEGDKENLEEEDGNETKNTYKVVEDVDEDDGSSAHYTAGDDGGSSDHGEYNEGGEEGDSENYTSGEGNAHFTEESSDGGDHASFTEGDGEHYSEGGDGSSEHYTNEGGDDEGDGEAQHYTAEEAEEDDY